MKPAQSKNTLMDLRGAKRGAIALTACFLAIHIGLLAMFWRFGVTPMVYFNVFSVAFYLVAFVFIRRGMFMTWVITSYLEVLAHMSCAVYFVGWSSGFQISLIGIILLPFFSRYIAGSLDLPAVPAVPLGLMATVVYLVLLAAFSNRVSPYSLPETVALNLHAASALATFVIVILSLDIFSSIVVRSEKYLAGEASHDRLTGLPNRYYMSKVLNDKAAAGQLGSCWLAMVDIDDFKTTNDTYGHVCGDEVLKALADVFSNFDADIEVCRWGGEEFLFVGTFADEGAEGTRKNLERLRTAVAGHTIWYKDTRINLSITIGVAAYQEGYTIVEWINAADEKLYFGKQHGKNQVVM